MSFNLKYVLSKIDYLFNNQQEIKASLFLFFIFYFLFRGIGSRSGR